MLKHSASSGNNICSRGLWESRSGVASRLHVARGHTCDMAAAISRSVVADTSQQPAALTSDLRLELC